MVIVDRAALLGLANLGEQDEAAGFAQVVGDTGVNLQELQKIATEVQKSCY